MNVTLVNKNDGSVEGHKAGCRDIKRNRTEESWTLSVETKRDAFLAYNSDFLDEGQSEDEVYQIKWLPCADEVPAVEETFVVESTGSVKNGVVTIDEKTPITKAQAFRLAKQARHALATVDGIIKTGDARQLEMALESTILNAQLLLEDLRKHGVRGL